MPSAISLFLLFLYFRKVTTGNIVGLHSNFTEIFYATEDTRGPKGDLGATQGPRAGSSHSPTLTRGWGPPLPSGHRLGPLRRL